MLGGILLLLVGCATSLHLAWSIAGARISALFDTLVTHAPTERLAHLRCPLLLVPGETAEVRASVVNPTDGPLLYRVHFTTGRLYPLAEQELLQVPIAGRARWRASWTVRARETGVLVVVVEAISDRDQKLSGYHAWPTSFRQGCGILVLKSAAERGLRVGVGLGGLVGGTVLCSPWLAAWIKRRRQVRG